MASTFRYTPLIIRILLIAGFLMTMTGCASLPRKEEFMKPPDGAESCYNAGQLDLRSKVILGHLLITESIFHRPILPGNRVTILGEGDVIYAQMFDAVRSASAYVHLETFEISDDPIGGFMCDLLLEKTVAGIEVNLIYDAFGSRKTPADFFFRLENAGAGLLKFNPPTSIRWPIWEILRRDHCKIMVVDGKIGFTGSANICDLDCSSKSHKKKQIQTECFKDLHLKIEGPAAAELGKAFLQNWELHKGQTAPKDLYIPVNAGEGDKFVQILASTPGAMNRLNYMAYFSAIANSEKTIRLSTPYFVPGREMIAELITAAKRGVDIVIVVPTLSDSRFVSYAGMFYYNQLLEAGIRIYQHPAMLHTKFAIIDGVWCTVGTSNLDTWSLLVNNEVNAYLFDPDFAQRLESALQLQVRESKQITLENWKKRSLGKRLRERLAHMVERWA